MQKHIGGIAESNGKEVAEETIYNALEKKKTFCGIQFDRIDRNVKMYFKLLDLKGEFDIVLENGDTLAIIEAKHNVEKKDVIKLYEKQADKFRKLFPTYKNYKIILGIGGLSFDKGVEEEANRNGIGLIKVTGEGVEFHTSKIKIY